MDSWSHLHTCEASYLIKLQINLDINQDALRMLIYIDTTENAYWFSQRQIYPIQLYKVFLVLNVY